MFTETSIKSFEGIGLRPIGIYLPSNAAGISWCKDEAYELVYNNPEFLWSTTDRPIKQDRYSFENTATMFGRTHIKTETEEYFNLNALDIDCRLVLNRLSISIEQLLANSSWDWVTPKLQKLVKVFLNSVGVVNGDYSQSLLDVFKNSTFVTKTRKIYGHHIYWLSREQKKAIGSAYCRSGFEFEIKTDNTLGLCTLPGSAHKEDLDFRYESVGITDHILANDLLYDLLLEMFKDCLSNGKLDDNVGGGANTNNNNNNNSNSNNNNLSDSLKDMTTLLIIDNSVVIAKPHRHHTLVSIANSLLFKHSETKSNAELKEPSLYR